MATLCTSHQQLSSDFPLRAGPNSPCAEVHCHINLFTISSTLQTLQMRNPALALAQGRPMLGGGKGGTKDLILGQCFVIHCCIVGGPL